LEFNELFSDGSSSSGWMSGPINTFPLLLLLLLLLFLLFPPASAAAPVSRLGTHMHGGLKTDDIYAPEIYLRFLKCDKRT
jgi:hypothetical protein